MGNYTRKNRILISILVLLVSLGMYFILFMPEHHTLKDVTLENFYYVSDAKYENINNVIISNVESTEFMSSRTVIKNAIADYIDGLISFRELYDFSYDKYEDGYEVMEYVVEALRIVDGQILLDLGETFVDTDKIVTEVEGLRELRYELVYENERSMIVYSPIFAEDDIYGYDVIVFDLEEVLLDIQEPDYIVGLTNTDTNQIVFLEGFEYIYQEYGHYIYSREVSDNHSLVISIDESVLYGNLNQLLLRNLVLSVFIIAVVMFIGNALLIRNTKELVKKLSSQHDMYKDKAMTDNLTKTYSRQFLDQIMYDGTLKVSETVIVMIDINYFKDVNDRYGHLVGDEVLKFIGFQLTKTFEKDDFVVRYGGDEFLVFVKSKNLDAVVNIFRNFNAVLNQISEYDFGLSISYGISFVDSLGNLDEGIREADKALYKNKEKIKS